MSITDELRKWAEGDALRAGMSLRTARDQALAIADRIDAEHERKCAESWMRGHDAWSAIDRSDEMAEHGWIRLPKDADGVPWHIGDITESGQTVGAMGLNRHGWSFVGIVNEIDPAIHRHYVPTVEDVLRDACKAYHSLMVESMSDVAHDMPAPSEVIAEFAAKLRLAGDAS